MTEPGSAFDQFAADLSRHFTNHPPTADSVGAADYISTIIRENVPELATGQIGKVVMLTVAAMTGLNIGDATTASANDLSAVITDVLGLVGHRLYAEGSST